MAHDDCETPLIDEADIAYMVKRARIASRKGVASLILGLLPFVMSALATPLLPLRDYSPSYLPQLSGVLPVASAIAAIVLGVQARGELRRLRASTFKATFGMTLGIVYLALTVFLFFLLAMLIAVFVTSCAAAM